MKYFLAFIQPTKTIYIKVDIEVHEPLVDFIHDVGYKTKKITPNKWEYNIDNGLSYELDTIEELDIFIKRNRNTVKKRTYAI